MRGIIHARCSHPCCTIPASAICGQTAKAVWLAAPFLGTDVEKLRHRRRRRTGWRDPREEELEQWEQILVTKTRCDKWKLRLRGYQEEDCVE